MERQYQEQEPKPPGAKERRLRFAAAAASTFAMVVVIDALPESVTDGIHSMLERLAGALNTM
jgi:hypothetical protein